jgi:Carboxypeptidase regulatory-like domain
MAPAFRTRHILFALAALGWASSCLGQVSPQSLVPPESQSLSAEASQPPGTIHGTVLDQSGAVVSGARVSLSRSEQSQYAEVLSGADGQFSFSNVAPGPFRLAVISAGFGAQVSSGTLHAGEIDTVPPVVLDIAMNVTEIQVGIPQVEVAEEQIKVEETQRVLYAIPNFYVSYVPNAAPLDSKQKFDLAWKTLIDPFTFAVVAGAAGVQQAQNHFRDYGQGAQGYGKRFGASYADTVTGVLIGSAILPSILKQDPRYFYKGTGSKPSRFLYAIAGSVICKGDNGRWQPNYSNVLGSLAAGGISNLYYPASDREGADLTLENAGIGIGASAAANVLQEFFIRKISNKGHNRDSIKP